MSTVTTYYWVVHYPNGIGAAVAKPAAKRQPEPEAQIFSVSVIHRDLYTTQKAEFVMPRNAAPNDKSLCMGDSTNRIVVTNLHPGLQEAKDWMAQEWAGMQAKGAKYAELHSFEVTASDLVGFP